MAFSYIQGKSDTWINAGSTVTQALGQATGVNNHLVVSFYLSGQGITGITVTDDATPANTYLSAIGEVDIPGAGACYQFYGVQKNSATHVTISWSGTFDIAVVYDEFSGGVANNSGVFNKAASNSGGSATNASVAAFSPSDAGELVVGCIASSVPFTYSSPAGGANYTVGSKSANPANHGVFTIYNLNASTSETAPASWTTASAWGEIAAAYNPAIAGSVSFVTAPMITIVR